MDQSSTIRNGKTLDVMDRFQGDRLIDRCQQLLRVRYTQSIWTIDARFDAPILRQTILQRRTYAAGPPSSSADARVLEEDISEEYTQSIPASIARSSNQLLQTEVAVPACRRNRDIHVPCASHSIGMLVLSCVMVAGWQGRMGHEVFFHKLLGRQGKRKSSDDDWSDTNGRRHHRKTQVTMTG